MPGIIFCDKDNECIAGMAQSSLSRDRTHRINYDLSFSMLRISLKIQLLFMSLISLDTYVNEGHKLPSPHSNAIYSVSTKRMQIEYT